MSDSPPRIETDEQLARLHDARKRGGVCAWCGRTLAVGEPIYVEQVPVDVKPFTGKSLWKFRRTVGRDAPLGAECAAPELVRRMEGQEPEYCEACGRPIYRTMVRASRVRVACSKDCRNRLSRGRRATGEASA